MSKRIDLSKMPTPDLIREFEELATQQGYAQMWLDVSRLKKLYKLVELVTNELDRRGDLGSLSALFNHENVWVRYRAAVHSRKINPAETDRILRELAQLAPHQVAFQAKTSLRNWLGEPG